MIITTVVSSGATNPELTSARMWGNLDTGQEFCQVFEFVSLYPKCGWILFSFLFVTVRWLYWAPPPQIRLYVSIAQFLSVHISKLLRFTNFSKVNSILLDWKLSRFNKVQCVKQIRQTCNVAFYQEECSSRCLFCS